MQRKHETSAALCGYVRALPTGPTALLSFSCGKDAIVSWLQLRAMGFTRIIPFYLYLVPDLGFVERSLRYYEQYFGTEIIRVPHPSLYRMLHNRVFQPPERWRVIEDLRLPVWEYGEVEDYVRAAADVDKDTFVAIGTRTADSPTRLANIRRHGALNPGRRSFCPVYDWRIDDVVGALKAKGVRLPVDYQMFGRSFDGIDYRFLRPISERFPDDYERILQWFPLARLELLRRQWSEETI